jgi:chorismate mutase
MNKLAQLRNIIASLDETLVKAFCGRSLFKVNAEMYNELKHPLSIAETAALFGATSTIAGRAHILRPLYVNTLLPVLCDPGRDEDRRKCIAADASCMTALVQRLNLSVHVASLKLEEIPESLRIPLQNRDPVQMEEAIKPRRRGRSDRAHPRDDPRAAHHRRPAEYDLAALFIVDHSNLTEDPSSRSFG